MPQWADPADERHAITTDQLLRMASGLEWNETYLDTSSDTVAMLSGVGKDDMAAYAADKPLEVPPGTRVRYATGTSNIVAGIIGDEVGHGADYEAFIQRELLDPLGIRPDEVAPGFDGAGNLIGGSIFDATARSFAKIGYLHLRGGEWDGKPHRPRGLGRLRAHPDAGRGREPRLRRPLVGEAEATRCGSQRAACWVSTSSCGPTRTSWSWC